MARLRFDFDVFFSRSECGVQVGVLFLGEILDPGAEGRVNPVDRVTAAVPVPESGLLRATADLVNGGGAELDDMERIEHRHSVFELIVDRPLVAREGIKGCDLHVPTESVRRARRATQRTLSRSGRAPGPATSPESFRACHR